MPPEPMMLPGFGPARTRLEIVPPPPVVESPTLATVQPRQEPAQGAADNLGLRPYQQEATEAIAREHETHRATLLVIPTGMGKTRTAGAYVARWKAPHPLWPGAVLWIAHRDELLDQARRDLEHITGEVVSLEQGMNKGGGTRIMVASVATMKGRRLTNWARDRFGLVVVDEAHHVSAQSYQKILAHFEGAKVLGLTATPGRSDGQALGDTFQSVAYERDICWGIEEGYLVPFDLVDKQIESIDIARAKTIMGDVDASTVEDEIVKAVAPIAQAVREETPKGSRSLTFTPRVGSAHAVSEAINSAEPDNSRCVDGNTEKFERKLILKNHKSGYFQHLLNCLVFTEGYDDPGLLVGCIARITKSRELYMQMLGRFLRPLKGICELPTRELRLAAIAASAKPRAIIIDITGHAGRHAEFLISPVDILGGKYTDEERKWAKKNLKKNRGDVGEALEKARAELQAEEQEQARRLAARAAASKAKMTRRVIDPFRLLLGQPEAPSKSPYAGNPADAEDLLYLQKYDVNIPPACTDGQARQLVAAIKMRRAKGYCTYKMARFLASKGIDASTMSFEKGSALMAVYRQYNFHPPREAVNWILRGRTPGADDGDEGIR